ncbi:MAG: hypothetical protein ACFCUX_04140 [Candidatus Methylacidiphilales bacterium]
MMNRGYLEFPKPGLKWICILALFLPCLVHARLGENEAELKKRFGEPVTRQPVRELNFEVISYKNHDLQITVTLMGGKSASEQYLRTEGKKDAAGKPLLIPIPAEMATAILNANAQDGTWQELPPEEGKRKFVRSDKEGLALFFLLGSIITEVRISSSEYNRHLSQFAR